MQSVPLEEQKKGAHRRERGKGGEIGEEVERLFLTWKASLVSGLDGGGCCGLGKKMAKVRVDK